MQKHHLPTRQLPRRNGREPRLVRSLLDRDNRGGDIVHDGHDQSVPAERESRILRVRFQATERSGGLDLRIHAVHSTRAVGHIEMVWERERELDGVLGVVRVRQSDLDSCCSSELESAEW